MQYGYFDDKNREYVITNPKLPTPWMNYLGNGGFGGLISATAGGLTFDKDPSNRRITRYKFNNMPIDRPGRYLYIRDEETGDYFSPMWQPVQKEMQFFECRHGLGYTVITGQCMDICSKTEYYVPIGKNYEIWHTSLKNNSDRTRKLKIFSYVEFSYPEAQTDILCHWACMTLTQEFKDNKIIMDSGVDGMAKVYVATSLPVSGFDCDPREFIGPYRSEGNPIALERGRCFNSLAESDNCIGVLCSEVVLEPNAEIKFVHTLGVADKENQIEEQIAESFDSVLQQLAEIHKKWDAVLGNFKVKSPCSEMDQMLNCWHQYQCKTTFDWSRFISLYERGVDRGFGFRDSMQDVLGIMYSEPDKAKERIKLLLSIQNKEGDAKAVYYPATGEAKGGGRSDDHLWSILSVCNYIKETGDSDFLNEQIPFYNGGTATVSEHLERAIDFTMDHLGRHGIPDFLHCDWDDSLWFINKNGGAESTFVFFQLAHGARELIKLYKHLNMNDRLSKMEDVYDYCLSKLDIIWDGKWFIRGFTSDGKKFCTDEDKFNKIHLIPQSWAVLSELADENRANIAMDNVMKYLYTEKGLITHYPASGRNDGEEKMFYAFPAGARENGGIFFHSNTWAITAFAMLGRSEDAFKCYYSSLPNRRNNIADLCLTEPYVYSQTMIAPPHSRKWQCVNSWLTGTASWMFYAATQYILGIRPEYDGLCIDPKIPSEWSGFEVVRNCRGTRCEISVKNNAKALYVNGDKMSGNTVPWELFGNGTLSVELK